MHRYTGVKNSFPRKYHARASTTKRNVETSSRQSWANKTNCKPPSPPYILAYIHENPIRRKFQIIRGGRRKIYIYRDREYRFRATSIMEDSVQGSAIILQHPPLELRPPRPLSSVIQSVYIYIYARYRSAAWRDGIPSPVNAGSLKSFYDRCLANCQIMGYFDRRRLSTRVEITIAKGLVERSQATDNLTRVTKG